MSTTAESSSQPLTTEFESLLQSQRARTDALHHPAPPIRNESLGVISEEGDVESERVAGLRDKGPENHGLSTNQASASKVGKDAAARPSGDDPILEQEFQGLMHKLTHPPQQPSHLSSTTDSKHNINSQQVNHTDVPSSNDGELGGEFEGLMYRLTHPMQHEAPRNETSGESTDHPTESRVSITTQAKHNPTAAEGRLEQEFEHLKHQASRPSQAVHNQPASESSEQPREKTAVQHPHAPTARDKRLEKQLDELLHPPRDHEAGPRATSPQDTRSLAQSSDHDRTVHTPSKRDQKLEQKFEELVRSHSIVDSSNAETGPKKEQPKDTSHHKDSQSRPTGPRDLKLEQEFENVVQNLSHPSLPADKSAADHVPSNEEKKPVERSGQEHIHHNPKLEQEFEQLKHNVAHPLPVQTQSDERTVHSSQIHDTTGHNQSAEGVKRTHHDPKLEHEFEQLKNKVAKPQPVQSQHQPEHYQTDNKERAIPDHLPSSRNPNLESEFAERVLSAAQASHEVGGAKVTGKKEELRTSPGDTAHQSTSESNTLGKEFDGLVNESQQAAVAVDRDAQHREEHVPAPPSGGLVPLDKPDTAGRSQTKQKAGAHTLPKKLSTRFTNLLDRVKTSNPHSPNEHPEHDTSTMTRSPNVTAGSSSNDRYGQPASNSNAVGQELAKPLEHTVDKLEGKSQREQTAMESTDAGSSSGLPTHVASDGRLVYADADRPADTHPAERKARSKRSFMDLLRGVFKSGKKRKGERGRRSASAPAPGDRSGTVNNKAMTRGDLGEHGEWRTHQDGGETSNQPQPSEDVIKSPEVENKRSASMDASLSTMKDLDSPAPSSETTSQSDPTPSLKGHQVPMVPHPKVLLAPVEYGLNTSNLIVHRRQEMTIVNGDDEEVRISLDETRVPLIAPGI
ncbi:uncharacterized protein SPPG_06002 [Spizellomyces punctatus DAOM BR117]|uniref:Uncharacterized protein n=1 Tax=Spizellomyces punctatus (strain DAOM BR117) TaxID=645134 RepID=A0A0L0HDH3_SPIPD|nr:uncharacterized protein SPPG_06002 [Spizellomyces punctatus DAOM BR117]KNC99051.1 hypothetical protein SPPG_06002 [Spizellomyces punctatus DAOM BR117]|eukprot:XP_016607091.1 hypothetical protein SPPG_06002 [Spizellomyces punctatus DAOM BR117]